VRAFGAPSGGAVTPADFARPEGLDVPALRAERLSAPWASTATAAFARGACVSAIDVSGMFVAAAFECQPEALYVDELELSAPLVAVPTLRGVPRTAPGAAIPAAAPIWIDFDASGSAAELWAAPGARTLTDTDQRRFGIRRNAAARTVEGIEA
jgi:hypothetical protein